VCAVYLINRGADPEKIDIYGNTCLGVGLLYNHYNYGIILIEKNLDVKKLVFREDAEKIRK
jgi:ankyrin repeat protein